MRTTWPTPGRNVAAMDGSRSASSCASMTTRYALSTLQVQGRISKAADSAAGSADAAKASFFQTMSWAAGHVYNLSDQCLTGEQHDPCIFLSLNPGVVLRSLLSCCLVMRCDAL